MIGKHSNHLKLIINQLIQKKNLSDFKDLHSTYQVISFDIYNKGDYGKKILYFIVIKIR